MREGIRVLGGKHSKGGQQLYTKETILEEGM